MQKSNEVTSAKVQKKFNPQPGDKIICNNGKEFICCTLEFLHEEISNRIQTSLPILGYYKTKYNKFWQDWDEYGTTRCNYFDYSIREVIPAESKEVVKKKKLNIVCKKLNWLTITPRIGSPLKMN